MCRRTQGKDTPGKQRNYGPGLLTLTLKDGREVWLTLHTRHHPSGVVRTLLSRGIAFSNCRPPQPSGELPQDRVFRRPSLYMFWHTVLFLLFFAMGFKMLMGGLSPFSLALGCAFFLLAIYVLYLLQTRFCYLTLGKDELLVHSAGRVLRYPYKQLLKVNFDFAREQNFTHVMEVLEKDYRYHLFYIGRVPRTQLNEIANLLQQAGIDATCSLNDEKRHYYDVHRG